MRAMDIATRPVEKRGVSFALSYVKGHAGTEEFIHSAFPTWENDTYDVLDKFLRKDAVFVDIGAWIGPLALYASQKCEKVYCVEPDPVALRCLRQSITVLACDNIAVIDKALYSNNGDVCFGKNKFLQSSSLGDSTSHILHSTGTTATSVAAISVKAFITLLPEARRICLIKMDIEGGEEFVLHEVCRFCSEHAIPLHVSFHLPWWTALDMSALAALLETYYPVSCNSAMTILTHNGFASFLFT